MLNRFSGLDSWARVRWLCQLLACWLVTLPALAAEGGTGGTAAKGGAGGLGGSAVEAGGASVGSAGGPSALDAPVVREVQTSVKLTPTEVMRGGAVTLVGDNLPSDKAKTFIWLDDFEAGHPLSVSADRKSLMFVVPNAGQPVNASGEAEGDPEPLLARRYVLSFSEGRGGRKIAAGVLRITPEKLPPLRVDAVSPTIVYPNTKQIVLTGDGMGGRMRDYLLLVDGTEISLCAAEEALPKCDPKAPANGDCCKGLNARFSSDHQLEILGWDDSNSATGEELGKFQDATGQVLSGDHKLGLRVGDATGGKAVTVAFSSHSTATIRYTALSISLLLLAAMVALVVLGGSKHYVGSRQFVGKAFLIDTETDTYSLSKLQFYLWSTAALFAYCYLSLSRCLVQGKLDIADIPENLPTILGLSAGTAITSIGIAKLRGPKAAGVIHPRFGDLLSSGGVVSPERFTYLLWTIVAIATFLLNVWNVDSMVLNDLPKIPQGLLALSGLSSAAYLGGKFARGAGPVVDEVLSTKLPPNAKGFALLLMGRNMAVDATFEVEGQSITHLLDPVAHADRRAIAGKREEGERAGQYAKSLTIVLTTLPETWDAALKQEPDPNHLIKLTVANPDGQRAEVEVPRTALTPVPVSPIPANVIPANAPGNVPGNPGGTV